MERAWSYQPASPKGKGLHIRGRYQMETNRRRCQFHAPKEK
ncbi:12076_t:CDS:1, partial [Gigaspora rosea]